MPRLIMPITITLIFKIFKNSILNQMDPPLFSIAPVLEEVDEEIDKEGQKVQNLIKVQAEVPSSPSPPRKRGIKRLHSHYQIPLFRSHSVAMDNFERIMTNNKIWAKTIQEEDPDFFIGLAEIQKPEYLWIGCSDSRVPANEICGLKSGEVFVHRNVANQAPPSDINFLAVLQYAVQVLKVTDIIVSGHYGCGGIKAAFKKHDHGPLQAWLSHIREIRYKYRKQLVLPTQEQNQNLLVELNIKQQVYNVGRVPIVQQAWKNGRELRIHGLVYKLNDGLLKDIGITINNITHLPKEFVITD